VLRQIRVVENIELEQLRAEPVSMEEGEEEGNQEQRVEFEVQAPEIQSLKKKKVHNNKKEEYRM